MSGERTERLLSIAEKRNRSIPEMLKSNSVYRPLNPLVRFVSNDIIGRLLVGKAELIGEENLKRAEDLVKTEPVLFYFNHQTDFDAHAKAIVLGRNGFGHVAARMVYSAGLKMIERASTRFFTPSENMIYVPTPFDMREIEEVLGADESCLNDQQRKLVEDYQRNCRSLSSRAWKEMFRQKKGGKFASTYPEGGRTRDPLGRMRGACPETAAYFRDTWAVPIVNVGSIEAFPPERKFRFFKAFPRKLSLKVIVGRPFHSDMLWDGKRKPESAEEAELGMSRAMAMLAVLNPSLVHPDQRLSYFGNSLVDLSQDLERAL